MAPLNQERFARRYIIINQNNNNIVLVSEMDPLIQQNMTAKARLSVTMRTIQDVIGISQTLRSGDILVFMGHRTFGIIPVKAKEALENVKDFEPYTNQPSQAFLQFAERHLSLNKSDPSNNPAFKSCHLRVPYTFNSKSTNEGIDPEVKVVQQWDDSQPLQDIDNLLVEFQTFLIDQKLKSEVEEKKSEFKQYSHTGMTNTIPYVERLLTTPIADYRYP